MRCHGEINSFSKQTEFNNQNIIKEADQRIYFQEDISERFLEGV